MLCQLVRSKYRSAGCGSEGAKNDRSTAALPFIQPLESKMAAVLFVDFFGDKERRPKQP